MRWWGRWPPAAFHSRRPPWLYQSFAAADADDAVAALFLHKLPQAGDLVFEHSRLKASKCSLASEPSKLFLMVSSTRFKPEELPSREKLFSQAADMLCDVAKFAAALHIAAGADDNVCHFVVPPI